MASVVCCLPRAPLQDWGIPPPVWELTDSCHMSVSPRTALPPLKNVPCPKSCPSLWGQPLLIPGQSWGRRRIINARLLCFQETLVKGPLSSELPMESFVATASHVLLPLSNLPPRETNTESPTQHHSSRKPTSHLMASWWHQKGQWLNLTRTQIWGMGFAFPALRASTSTITWARIVCDSPARNPVYYFYWPGNPFHNRVGATVAHDHGILLHTTLHRTYYLFPWK